MNNQYLKEIDAPLDVWIAKKENQELFPPFGSTNYPESYQMMAEYLDKHVHPNVTKGAIAQQIRMEPSLSFDNVIYLNDHGPDHVKMVISRASELLQKTEAKITPYEAYILLVAIHFHDVGIWLGRDGHEKTINQIMQIEGVKKHLPQDDLVLSVIRKIAQAHGGYMNGNKDTIDYVKQDFVLNHQEIRKQFLAAVLRFADELADERTRAERFVIEGGSVPEHSRIYHEYSNSLHTVMVSKKEIDLHYHMPKSKAMKKYAKLRKEQDTEQVDQVYLLDEIYKRTLKMHREKQYCARFLIAGGIFIERIRVTIEIYDDQYDKCIEEIPYELREKGYPSQKEDISILCPNLHNKNGEWLVGRLNSNNAQES